MSIDYQRFEKKNWMGDKADHFNIRGKPKRNKVSIDWRIAN